MSDRNSPTGEVAAILSQFPGPVTLFPSKFRILITSTVAMLLVALFIWFTWNAARSGNLLLVAVYGFCVLVCAYAVIVSALASLTDLYFITLNANGFETQFAWKKRRRSWNDVGPFAVLSFIRGATVVAFDDETCRSGVSRKFNLLMTKHNSLLPGYFGLENEDMARLMTEWRARALGLKPWIS